MTIRTATARRTAPSSLAGVATVTACAAVAVTLVGAAPGPARADTGAAAVPAAVATAAPEEDGLVVRFHPVVTEPAQEQVVAAAGAELGESVGTSGWTRVEAQGRDPQEVLAELAGSGAVAEVEVDPARTVAAVPDDPYFPRQAGLSALRLPAAWDVTTGSTSTVLAVLDTGVDAAHPDLAGRVLPGTDIANRDSDPRDDHGHGTGVAGAAAATGNNRIGLAGVDWRARVLPVKVLRADGSGRDSDIAEGIRWATDHGATVVNLSLGGPQASNVLADAVTYALARGVVVVAAAGNTGRQELSYPAAFPDVIAVTATDDGGAPASFSTTGTWVDVAAPGVGVPTTGLSSRSPYVSMTGTSFAAPLVSGVVGLVRARNPGWTPLQVHDWVRRTARDVDAPGLDPRTGAGLVDAAAAVARTSSATGTVAISERYAQLGGAQSVLGTAVGPEQRTPDGVGRYVHYERGSIYWTPQTGAHEVYGAIRERWARLGWERSPLGYPVTGELSTPNGRGRYVHFQHGSVYWSPGTGAQEVYGAIRDRWASLRWEAGPLGLPRTGETSTPDGTGRYNHFQGGSVYWSPTTGAHGVWGAIRERWVGLRGEAGPLGYPTSSEYDVPGGRATDFQRGRIAWNRATGALTVTTR